MGGEGRETGQRELQEGGSKLLTTSRQQRATGEGRAAIYEWGWREGDGKVKEGGAAGRELLEGSSELLESYWCMNLCAQLLVFHKESFIFKQVLEECVGV